MKYSKLKTILFSISAIGLFFIFMEASLRVIYYQKSEPEPLCVMKVYKNLRKGYLQRAAQKKAGDMAFSKDHLRFLYSEVGKDLLAELKTRYEDEFKKLRDELSKDNVHLVMLYLPHYAYWNTHMPDSREFFKGLAERSGVDFIDMTDELLFTGRRNFPFCRKKGIFQPLAISLSPGGYLNICRSSRLTAARSHLISGRHYSEMKRLILMTFTLGTIICPTFLRPTVRGCVWIMT